MPVTTICKRCGAEVTSYLSSARKFCSSKCANTGRGVTTHGASGTRLHSLWCGMKGRCKGNNLLGKKYYAECGILVCAQWQSYETFRDWAMVNGYRDNLEIDRIDNDKGYYPDNCRWVTRHQQMQNTRSRRVKNRTSQYRGVQRLHKSISPRPWRATCFAKGKINHIGVFATELEAAKARDAYATKHHGEFAYLNFRMEVSHLSSQPKNI